MRIKKYWPIIKKNEFYPIVKRSTTKQTPLLNNNKTIFRTKISPPVKLESIRKCFIFSPAPEQFLIAITHGARKQTFSIRRTLISTNNFVF